MDTEILGHVIYTHIIFKSPRMELYFPLICNPSDCLPVCHINSHVDLCCCLADEHYSRRTGVVNSSCQLF